MPRWPGKAIVRPIPEDYKAGSILQHRSATCLVYNFRTAILVSLIIGGIAYRKQIGTGSGDVCC